MFDIEARLRTAMHSALDGEEASPDRLLRLVMRRHRLRAVRLAGAAVLAVLALAVPTAIALHNAISRSGSPSSSRVTRGAKLPAQLSGLPMPAGMDFGSDADHARSRLVLDRHAANRADRRPARCVERLSVRQGLGRVDGLAK